MGARWLFLLMCVAGLASCQATNAMPDRARGAGVRADAGAGPDAGAAAQADWYAFDPRFFERKKPARADDWLASFPEPGQTFPQYVVGRPKGLTAKRTVIVLQPMGPFAKDELAALDELRDFTRAFFQLTVRIERPVPLPDHGKRPRRTATLAWTQYHTRTLMADVLLPRLPDDAVCYLGITMADLYPDPAWNFVFGEATFSQRVGVYSLARYTHRFWGRAETDESRRMFLRRGFKILAHETGHMFSLAHCTQNECLMNGSNSLEEMDRQTIHLCPLCLRKLQWNLKFDVARHYRELRDLYARNGYGDLAEWVEGRLVSHGGAREAPGEAGAP